VKLPAREPGAVREADTNVTVREARAEAEVPLAPASSEAEQQSSTDTDAATAASQLPQTVPSTSPSPSPSVEVNGISIHHFHSPVVFMFHVSSYDGVIACVGVFMCLHIASRRYLDSFSK